MFGYNLAAAHLGLRHTISHSFAVSDPWAGGEGTSRLLTVIVNDLRYVLRAPARTCFYKKSSHRCLILFVPSFDQF
ncbi:MAG: hypothetical protein ACI8RD_014303 [Bacillariaceae sp.]|jgi:hypothetical protein